MSLAALLLATTAPTALGEPSQDVRARSLELEIRCVQCENEPIAQSTAEIAADMRALVRERIAAGDSDEDIRAYFRQRYGDFVLFRPPFDARTWALWAAPLLLGGAGIFAVLANRRRRSAAAVDFAPEEGER